LSPSCGQRRRPGCRPPSDGTRRGHAREEHLSSARQRTASSRPHREPEGRTRRGTGSTSSWHSPIGSPSSTAAGSATRGRPRRSARTKTCAVASSGCDPRANPLSVRGAGQIGASRQRAGGQAIRVSGQTKRSPGLPPPVPKSCQAGPAARLAPQRGQGSAAAPNAGAAAPPTPGPAMPGPGAVRHLVLTSCRSTPARRSR